MSGIPFSFEPLRRRVYTPGELFDGFDPDEPESFASTTDFVIYREYIASGKYAPRDYLTAMMQAMHDNAITQALRAFLHGETRPIGIMGGHELVRGSDAYRDVVALSKELTNRGFTMLSGGGPGAMEATHLGASLCRASDRAVGEAIRLLETKAAVPDLTSLVGPHGSVHVSLITEAHAWFKPAWEIASAVGDPGRSLAIPTWLYGHEPTTPLATHIAKYFQNSIREDGLLALATKGVVYVKGRAGTLQEIFQDTAQNYYRTFGDFSPMVFLGGDYWSVTIPAIPVLKMLFRAEDFERYVLVTNDVMEAADFLESRGSTESGGERIDRYLSHEVHRQEM